METKEFSLGKWTLFTSIGVVLSVLLILGLAAIDEALKRDDQSLMGPLIICISFMQWLLLKKQLAHSFKWIWLSYIGFALPYFIYDLFSASLNLNINNFFLILLLSGVFLSTYLQYRFYLKKISSSAVSWMVYGFLAWCAAATMTYVNVIGRYYQLPKHFLDLLSIIAILSSGPILGFISGKGILKVLKEKF